MKKILLTPVQFLYSVYAFLSFLLLLLIIFPIVVIASFLGKIKGGNLIYKMCSFWADAWFIMIGIYAKKIMQAPHDATKHYIFVANHASYMDIPMIVKAIRQPIRVLGKSEMGKIPIFGFLYRNAVVMVDRSNADNRAKSIMVLKSILRSGISIFIFPEGSFNTTDRLLKDFYDGAFRIAIETQTPIKPILFTDAVDRLHYRTIFSLTPGKCHAIFLEEISVENYTINDVQLLKEIVFNKMEEGLKKVETHGLASK